MASLTEAIKRGKTKMINRYLLSLSDGHESKNTEGWNGPPKENIVMKPYLVRPYLLPEEMQKNERYFSLHAANGKCILEKSPLTYLPTRIANAKMENDIPALRVRSKIQPYRLVAT